MRRGESEKTIVKKSCSVLFAMLILFLAVFAAPGAWAAELVITKEPAGEEVTEGDDAMFISRAQNYVGLVWLFISPDGATVYENTEALDAFPGLEMGGVETEELQLISIPYTMDGWYVQTRFIDEWGGEHLTRRVQITVRQGLVASPRVTMKSGGAKLTLGETRTLAVEAASPGGDPIKYQWYRSYSAARTSGEAILGATESEYTPPEELGQVFYFVGVWCVRGRDASAPIYTAPVAIVYTEPAATPEPSPTPAITPTPTMPPNRGGANPLLSGSNPFFTAVTALLVLTLLAVSVTALVLHAVEKKQRAKWREEDEVPADDE